MTKPQLYFNTGKRTQENLQSPLDMSLTQAVEVISGINEFGNLIQFVKSAASYLRSKWNGKHEQQIQEDDILRLQSDLGRLNETLPAMYNLIDRAEWRSDENYVAELLPLLKDAVYDAEDLLIDFKWYELKVTTESNATHPSPFIDFFCNVIQGSFNKIVDVQERLNTLYGLLEKTCLHEVTPRFDKSVRPETTSFPDVPEIFGRKEELHELTRMSGVPLDSRGISSKRKRKRSASNLITTSNIPVLPIVGIGGVGKTTLARTVRNHPQVESHFDMIIWIHVSDDFDVKRLTKDAIKSSSGREAITDHLDSLQHALVNMVNKKRLLLFLDDMWDDALKENGRCWKSFCAPFKYVLQGSMMLVTTRSQKVAYQVCTLGPFSLEGLKDDDFWGFFKQCVFGFDRSNIDPELERIGRLLFSKLSGSPLAAITLGRLLQGRVDRSHWINIQNSEMWEVRQEKNEILPTLRLSYIYLPFHLKRCFSFCAVFPKNHKFEKHTLAEIWVVEGFVESQGDIPAHDIACQYFEDLVNQSFFQMVHGKYVIPGLMHDMARLVSRHECFIIKDVTDFQKTPQNVRHLSILRTSGVQYSNLLSLRKYTKLRTLFCNTPLESTTSDVVMNRWFSELRCMRVIYFASTTDLPESISNMKHLRYLEIDKDCTFNTLPSGLCGLYHLQILYARKCRFESLPNDFGKLMNLQRFESQRLQYHRGSTMEVDVAAADGLEILRLLKNLNQFRGHLTIYNLGEISKDHAAEAQVKMKECLSSLTLLWSPLRSNGHSEIEVLQALHPPINIRYMDLEAYTGESLPRWFQPTNLPNLTSLRFCYCNRLDRISICNSNSTRGFLSLTDLSIERCQNLSSLEQFLQPAHVPAIEKIKIEDCQRLVSFPTATSGYLNCLEELIMSRCPNITSRGLLVPSLRKLELINPGALAENINCCSLTYLFLSCSRLTSIQLDMWSLPVLQKLKITGCDSLVSIGEFNLSHRGHISSIQTFSSLTDLSISNCNKLLTLDDLLTYEYLPAIQRIYISTCEELQSLPSERFESFPFLKDLYIWKCPRLKWERGMVLPLSLKYLSLGWCGDFSAWFGSCLEKLTSLVSLAVASCEHIVSIPGHLWSRNLSSVHKLRIENCSELVSIGRPEAIANIKHVSIYGCPKLEEVNQPLHRY